MSQNEDTREELKALNKTHSRLIQKMYSKTGLTSEEEMKLEQVRSDIDRCEEVLYDDHLKSLEKIVELSEDLGALALEATKIMDTEVHDLVYEGENASSVREKVFEAIEETWPSHVIELEVEDGVIHYYKNPSSLESWDQEGATLENSSCLISIYLGPPLTVVHQLDEDSVLRKNIQMFLEDDNPLGD